MLTVDANWWIGFVSCTFVSWLACVCQSCYHNILLPTIKLCNTFTGEYKTEVREVDPNERPIVSQSKSLSCYNSEENKGNPEAEQNAVRWIHDGHTVQNDSRHEGASTRVRYKL